VRAAPVHRGAGEDDGALPARLFALHDDARHVPAWISYRLTAEHAPGCLPRKNTFAADPDLSHEARAKPADYHGTGFDMGHLAPDADVMRESFYLSNMPPQLAKLNREGWERLEEAVRAWAIGRGEVLVEVGPIFGDAPETIGPDDVAVPIAFWKVVAAIPEAIAFEMPNAPVRKDEALTHVVAIADVEAHAALKLPIPGGIDRDHPTLLWAVDLAAVHAR